MTATRETLTSKILRALDPSLERQLSKYCKQLLSSFESEKFVAVQIFDLGAGSASYWLKVLPDIASRGNVSIDLHIVDLHPHFSANVIEALRKFDRISTFVHKNDILNFLDGYRVSKTVDRDTMELQIVTIFNVIEHLPKHEGWSLLYKIDSFLNQFSRKVLLLQVPNGFVYQPPSVDNSHNAHLSDWRISDVTAAGHKVISGLSRTKLQVLERLSNSRHFLTRLFYSFVSTIVRRASKRLSYEILSEKKRFNSASNSFLS